MLLGEVEGAHRPFLVAFKLADRVTVTVLHPIPNVTREQVEHLEELLSNLVDVGGLIRLVGVTHLFKAVIGAELDLLRVVHRLLLAHRPVKIDVLLLQSALGGIDLLHEDGCVFQIFVIFSKNLVLEHSQVLRCDDLRLERLKVAKSHVEDHLVVLLPEQEEQVQHFKTRLLGKALRVQRDEPRDGVVH